MLADFPLRTALAAAALATLGGMAVQAEAADIRVACYSDGNECPATRTLAERFMKDNADIHITIDEMPYKQILESVPVQLAAGNGPDIARISDFGQVAQYQLDLTPYLKDAAYWQQAYGPVLDWMRSGPDDHGIYGLMTQLTVSAPLVDKTLFDQAGVPVPAKGCHLGRLGCGRGQGRQGDQDPVRHGLGPQRRPLLGARDLGRRQILLFRRPSAGGR